MHIRDIILRRIDLPLVTPYRLSYRTFESFEPIIVEVIGDTGVGWGEGHISPGSSSETRAGGWAFVREMAGAITGGSTEAAKAAIVARWEDSKVAATALLTAIEMLERHPLLACDAQTTQPLLTPFNARSPPDIDAEVEERLSQGFRTIKIKVGADVDADLARLGAIQHAVAGRATLRIDADRAFLRDDGVRFAAGLNPEGIELFEQPCDDKDWEANARVAEVSPVPLMLDEPICAIADIERAARIAGVGFCKLKLKRFGGLDRLEEALKRVREMGMEPVLGDGLSAEIGCWMEACVARSTIRNAGEFNGFLKPRLRLFSNPLEFADGAVTIPAGYAPEIDRAVLEDQTIEIVHAR